MLTSPDFKELLNIFSEHNVRYLVVGDYAVMKYTEPRFTKDLDLWISPAADNARAVFSALKQFGAPLRDLTPDDFTDKSSYYQMGRPPFRMDIIMDLNGLDFEVSWSHRSEVLISNVYVPFISMHDLMESKKRSGRPQDLIDLENLLKAASMSNLME